MTDQRCENCRFWEDGGDSGSCRRHAPQFNPQVVEAGGEYERQDYERGFWPFTNPNDWCGEWQGKETEAT